MNQLITPPLIASSRLVRVLSELAASGIDPSPRNFSERLSTMIDFTGSVRLSDALGKVRLSGQKNTENKLETANSDARSAELCSSNIKCRESFVRVRKAATQSICQSFEKDNTHTRIKLPITEFRHFAELEPFSSGGLALDKAIDPYQKFYGAHQQELAAKIQGLRVHIREVVSNCSAELAALVILDQAVEDALAAGMPKSLKMIPKWLPVRFAALFEPFQNTTADLFDDTNLEASFGKTLNQFHSEMKDLLLAELELRLQPVLGLLEALNEEVNTST